LGNYVDFNPQDNAALFLLSDLYQMNGMVDLALEPLFKILDFPSTEQIRRQARKRLELLINATTQGLINSDDVASLVSFYEQMTAREPSYDRHRLEWARWLAHSGDLQAANRVMREVGSVGVTVDEVRALERELVLADSGLELIRHRNALHVEINVSNRRLVMLVDTGATYLCLPPSVIERLGLLYSHTQAVRTANGTVEQKLFKGADVTIDDRGLVYLADRQAGVDIVETSVY